MSKASLSYLGHSAVCITDSNNKQILIDPFLTGNPRCPTPDQEFPELSAICLTHGHSDHVGDTVRLAKHYGCKVCATFELAALLAKEGIPEANIEFMNKGGSVDLEQGKLTLEQAFHSSSFDASDGNTYYAGEAASLVLSLNDGPTIFHAGDTQLFSDLELIGKRYRPDIALLPIGDRFTMGPEDAAQAAQMLGVSKTIPIHYATFDVLSGTAKQFNTALAKHGIQALVLEPGQTLDI